MNEGRKTPKLFLEKYPLISSEFDRVLNLQIDLEKLKVSDTRDLIWRCAYCGKNWVAKPSNRKKYGDHKGCQSCKLEKKTTIKFARKWQNSPQFSSILSDELNENREPFLKPDQLKFSSSKKCWWTCRDCNFEWQATVKNRTKKIRKSGCPECAKEKRRLTFSQSQIKKHGAVSEFSELIEKEWDKIKNIISPSEVSARNTGKFYWVCSACNHNWRTSPFSRTVLGTGCPHWGQKTVGLKTSERALKKSGSFFERVPYLLDEWDFEKNVNLLPEVCTPQSNKKVWWKCSNNHSWLANISHRVNGSMCPKCTYFGTSLIELRVLSELSKLFSDVEWRAKEYGFEIDILVRSLNLAIEIDGYRWHKSEKNKKRDIKKSAELIKHFKLIRIRDYRLPNVGGQIISANIDKKHKVIMNDLMEKLASMGIVNNKIVQNYIAEKDLINHEYFYSLISNLPSPPKGKSFADMNPELAEDWDIEGNNGLTPFDIFSY